MAVKEMSGRVLAVILALLFTDKDNPMNIRQIEEQANTFIELDRAERHTWYRTMNILQNYLPKQIKKAEKKKGYYFGRTLMEAQGLMIKSYLDRSRVVGEKEKREISNLCRSILGKNFNDSIRNEAAAIRFKYKSEKEVSEYLERITEAVRKKKRIRFQYIELTSKFERKIKHGTDYFYSVSPYMLQHANETCYVHCADAKEKKYKTFRVDRMIHVDILEQDWESPAAYFGEDWNRALQKKMNETFLYYGEEEIVLKLDISCSGTALDMIYDFGGENIHVIGPVKNNREKILIETWRGPTLTRWLVGHAAYFRVLGPECVLEDIRELMREINKTYPLE